MGEKPPQDEFRARLSNFRHDLRTPIGHMIGYAELVEEDLEEEALKKSQHDLQAIQNASQKLLALIDHFFGDTKSSLDEIEIDDAQFQLRLLLNHISGYSEILREDALDAGNDDRVADLDHIANAQRQFMSLVESLVARLSGTPGKEKRAPAVVSANQTEPISSATVAGIGGEILIVDDDPGNRELLARRLTRGGYTSVCVNSGREALKALDKRRFDLVLLDYMMPEMSGLETLQTIKISPRLRTIPVIMLSATDETSLMVQCILSGAEDYVAKPFNPVLLIARINACLEKVRLRQNAARQIKVFISSPGDVIPERMIVKAVIGRLNDELAGRALLIPILWEEEPLLASDTFQAQIHPPRETEIYVGILWSRIGSPLPETIKRPDGTSYDSGSAFEFEDALNGYRENGVPEILLYRKDGAPTVSLDNKEKVLERIDQMDRLHSYVERFLIGDDGSYVAAFHTFGSDSYFDSMVETHLRKLVEKKLSSE